MTGSAQETITHRPISDAIRNRCRVPARVPVNRPRWQTGLCKDGKDVCLPDNGD